MSTVPSGTSRQHTPDDLADAAVTALLGSLGRRNVDRDVLIELADSAQAAVFAAEARNHDRR